MAVLEKIRVKFGILITILVALALLSFIIDPTTLRSAADMLSSDNQVGKMDGKSISYKDFYEQLDHYTKLAEMMGQPTNDEKAQSSLRDAAWQSIFDEQVFVPRAEKAGIAVGNQEMFDLTQGASISPVLLQQGTFASEDGNFSREALAQFVQSLDSDPSGNASVYWNFLEESVFKNQLYTKYASLIEASTLKNSVESQRIIAENNSTADIDFVLAPVTYAEDSTITVSNQEIRDYFNARKGGMKQPANRDIEYVMYEVVPSQQDINDTEEKFNEALEEFKAAENLKNFVALNSDSKWDTYYYKESQLEAIPEFKAVFGKKDAVSETHREELSFSAARVNDIKKLCDSAYVFYTAVPLTEEAIADSLFDAAKKEIPADFRDFGWMTQEVLINGGLTDLIVVFDGTSKVYKVRSASSQAWFILCVKQTTKLVEKVQFATLVKNIIPSDETYRDFLMKATDLSDRAAGKYENFAQICKDENLPVVPLNNVVESTRRIGPVENGREVIRWVFDKKTKKGEVSDVIIVDNKYYFVTAVTKTRKDGSVNINDVAQEIRTILLGQKKVEKLRGEVAAKIEGCTTIEQVAEKLGTTVSHQAGVSFGSLTQQLDPKFIGAIASAQPSQICGPVAGEFGVYVFQITYSQNGSFFTPEDVNQYASREKGYASQMMQSVLFEEAKVKDNRARFY